MNETVSAPRCHPGFVPGASLDIPDGRGLPFDSKPAPDVSRET